MYEIRQCISSQGTIKNILSYLILFIMHNNSRSGVIGPTPEIPLFCTALHT